MGPHGLVIGATGSGKSRAAAHPGARPGDHPLVGDPELRAGRLQGRRDLPRPRHALRTSRRSSPTWRTSSRWSTACTTRCTARWCAARSCCARPATTPRCATTSGPASRAPTCAPLPTLFVVLDEFSELLSAKPEFIDLFVMIGRLGRSLGVHLLLASQRLEEGRLRGLDTHLSYRIGLRTFSAMESRVVLGVADAYELPSAPGNGYLKFDTTGMTRFKAAYVSGRLPGGHRRRRPRRTARTGSAAGRRVRPRLRCRCPPSTKPSSRSTEPARGRRAAPQRSLLDVVVGRLHGHGPAAHRIWLPPLGEPPTLAHLLPPLSVTPEHGLTTRRLGRPRRLHAVVGIVDKPFDQRRDPYWLDLSGAAGHVGVVGAPQSGKSTVLRTLIASMALTHTPREVQFYCLDFGGGALAALEGLPHVGGVATRLDADRVRRTVAEIATLLQQRERDFAERGIDSIATYRAHGRRRRDRGRRLGRRLPRRRRLADASGRSSSRWSRSITDLAARGLGYGIHVVAATNKWSEFRPGIRDLFGTRLELKLGDAYESEVSRKAALAVPEGAPGRGLTKDGLHFLVGAAPHRRGARRPTTWSDGVARAGGRPSSAWQGPRPRPCGCCPPCCPSRRCPGRSRPARAGSRSASTRPPCRPSSLDFDADPHFVGLRRQRERQVQPAAAHRRGRRRAAARRRRRMMIVIDYRRVAARHGRHRAPHRLRRLQHRRGRADQGRPRGAARAAAARRTSPRAAPRRAAGGRARTCTSSSTTTTWWPPRPTRWPPLVDLLPQARDIGLHLVLARQMGGAGRAMFDPVVQRLKDMATPGADHVGQQGRGRPVRQRPAAAAAARPGHLVDRRYGARLIQTAFLDAEPAEDY